MIARQASWSTARAIAGDGPALPMHSVGLREALGCVLAAEVSALVDLPGFDTAAMDGFAVAGEGPWTVRGRVLAGAWEGRRLRPGEAVEIATGAAVPGDVDAVLPYEHVIRAADNRISGSSGSRRHIRRRGSDLRVGDLLAGQGHRVTAADLGLFAAAGVDRLAVRRRPRVDIVITGAELVTAGVPAAGHTRDALGPMLPGLLHEIGAETASMRQVSDDADDLAAALGSASADVLVVTGSSSVGPVDHLHRMLRETGVELLVDGVACRPGHPQLLGRRADGRPVVGLPGNPFAAVVGLVTLLVPLIAALDARVESDPVLTTLCPVSAERRRRADVTVLSPVRRLGDGSLEWLETTSSADLRAVAAATHLAVLAPQHDGPVSFVALPTGRKG